MELGQLSVQAQPFFQRFGGQMTREGDEFHVSRGGHNYRFRPGDRDWYFDNDRRTFRYPPYLFNDEMFLDPDDFIPLFGGSYYCTDPYTCGYAEFPGQWLGPGDVRIDNPKAGATLHRNEVVVQGYANPGRTVQLTVYLHGADKSDSQLVYQGSTQSTPSGYYSALVPLSGTGRYELLVRVINDMGGVEAEEDRWFKEK